MSLTIRLYHKEDPKIDKIDVLLFHKSTRELQFVEVKHFSNSELWSRSKPNVVKQIERYEKQLVKKHSHILTEYVNYISSMNSIFGLNLPYPQKVIKEVKLFVFGFDDDQKQGRLKKQIKENPEYSGITLYSKGNIKNMEMKALWKY